MNHYLSFKALAMKQKFKSLVAALIFVVISSCSLVQAQSQVAIPKWVPDKGYWVLESNIHSPLEHTVLFYNNENTLIYKETITGMRLNPKKARVKMKLKKALETALTAWERNGRSEENKEYLSAALK
jgi:hypothetical protein